MDETSLRARLDAQDWGNIHARLRDFAAHRCGSKAQGKDLAQSAIARVFAYDSKWEPETSPDLLRYLMSVVNSLLANERTSASAQRSVSLSSKKGSREAARVTDAEALSEAKIAEMDLFARRMARLEERLARDADSLRLLALTVAGVDTPAEICRATGWSLAAAAATRRRMQRAAAQVARELGDDGSDGAREEDEEDQDEEEVA